MPGHESALLGKVIFRLSFLALFALSPASIAMAEPASGELSKTLVWQMNLDVGGHITSLEPIGEGNRMLREKLESDVWRWEFNPGRIDGRPAETETRLTVEVSLLPNPDGETYAIQLKDVSTGGSILSSVAPSYPDAELGRLSRSNHNKGGAARMALEVSYDGSGRTVGMKVVEEATTASVDLIHAARVALRKARFEPERVGGKGIAGKMVMLYCVSVYPKSSRDPADIDPCQWRVPGSHSTLGDGQSLALDSNVHLKSDVIGKTL
jgi:hypothetical protein